MFSIEILTSAFREIAALRAFDRTRILDEIGVHLASAPTTPTDRKKELVGLEPPWEHVKPVWELRVGDYRVFYDVNAGEKRVTIRAVRRKGNRSTGEVL